MITFPSISKPSYPLSITPENNSLMSKFEDGTVQSRPKFTRSRRTFKVAWSGLPNEEYLILDNFIRNIIKYSANTFMWVNPATYGTSSLETVEVRLIDAGEPKLTVLDKWDVELTLQEV